MILYEKICLTMGLVIKYNRLTLIKLLNHEKQRE